MKYSKEDLEELKDNLTIEQIFELVAELGGEPQMKEDYLISKTICHNETGKGSYKLYYYDNTKLFKCYTDCGTTFDIYELVQKVKNVNGEKKSYYDKDGQLVPRRWGLSDAINYVISYFNLTFDSSNFSTEHNILEDWNILKNYERINDIKEKEQIVELKKYDSSILTHLPRPHILPWEKEGIKYKIMQNRGIAYNPKSMGVVIPHYDINGDLIGIRERTLVKEEEKYGKYKPSILNKQMYNHPLGFNLYNLNNSKDNIKLMQKVIVFEGEKSSLLYASYFGEENDISVACCGSSLISYQVRLLLDLGVKEIIVGLDKQFQEIGDSEWIRLTNKLKNIHEKYGAYTQISYLFDKEKLLNYKDSPIDQGADTFIKLYKERITL